VDVWFSQRYASSPVGDVWCQRVNTGWSTVEWVVVVSCAATLSSAERCMVLCSKKNSLYFSYQCIVCCFSHLSSTNGEEHRRQFCLSGGTFNFEQIKREIIHSTFLLK
jgi:hypothetical protein